MTHAISPGLWALAWRRLRADKVAMAALAVVCLFLVMLALSSAGLVAGSQDIVRNIEKEHGA